MDKNLPKPISKLFQAISDYVDRSPRLLNLENRLNNWIDGRFARFQLLCLEIAPSQKSGVKMVSKAAKAGPFSIDAMGMETNFNKSVELTEVILEDLKAYASRNPNPIRRWWLTKRGRDIMHQVAPHLVSAPPQIISPSIS